MSPLFVDRDLRRGKVWIGETANGYSDHLGQRLGQIEIDIAPTGRAEMKDQAVATVSLTAVDVSWPFDTRGNFGEPGVEVVTGACSSLTELAVAHKGQFRLSGDLYGNRTAMALGYSVQVLRPDSDLLRSRWEFAFCS